MKKYLLVLILATVLFSCSACVDSLPTQDAYTTLNKLQKEVTSYNLSVTTTVGVDSLTSVYEVKVEGNTTTVNYTGEMFVKIELEGDNSQSKQQLAGQVILENGIVKSTSGDGVDVIPSAPNYNFKKKYFANILEEDGRLSAEVANIFAFMGKNIDATDMTLEVEYTDETLVKLVVKYSTANSSVEIVYTF